MLTPFVCVWSNSSITHSLFNSTSAKKKNPYSKRFNIPLVLIYRLDLMPGGEKKKKTRIHGSNVELVWLPLCMTYSNLQLQFPQAWSWKNSFVTFFPHADVTRAGFNQVL